MRRSGGNDVAGRVVETLPGMVAGGWVAETLPGIVGATPVAAAVVDYWDVTGTNTEVTVVSVTALAQFVNYCPTSSRPTWKSRMRASQWRERR